MATRPRNRAKAFEALSRRPGPADLDPEADNDGAAPSDSDDEGVDYEDFGSEDEGAADAAREHYVDVGKSSLREKARKAGGVALGPRYVGVRVGREGLAQENDEDGFVDDGSGDWSESESGGDVKRLEDDDDDDDDEDDEEDAFDEDESDIKGEDDDLGDTRARPPTSDVDQKTKAQLREVMREERSVASALSKATQADAEKGHAVKKQRAMFDSLLGARMKLQKSLIGVNTLVGLEQQGPFDSKFDDAFKSAEDAAFKFWTALSDFREDLNFARTGEKRKRASLSASTPTGALWDHVQSQEEISLPQRNAILRKWSAKTGQATALPRDSGLRSSHQTATIIDALQQHLADSDRLLKRARTPRSCAPLQVSRQQLPGEDDARSIYDDADFYGQMLKELLEQKSSSADAAPAAAIDLDFKNVKTKRSVDTKASKGRKLRYTVHEKLQNFVAPEDRRTWGERQADELFGSLFGRRMALGEEEDVDGVDAVGVNEGDAEEEVDAADFVMFR